MGTLKTRWFLIVFVGLAFLGPFVGILTIEKAKRAEKLVRQQQEIAIAQRDAEIARYQYYLDLADRKNNLKQAMQEAKAQYEQLLKDQPGLIKEKQTAVTQTVIQPVVTQKVVEQAAPASSSKTTASKPKASATTKTS
ncbi:MAG: hypothetical protein WAT84_00630 [Candidatus Moraniibacteriota bacterium]